jgi:hypothetical protein
VSTKFNFILEDRGDIASDQAADSYSDDCGAILDDRAQKRPGAIKNFRYMFKASLLSVLAQVSLY